MPCPARTSSSPDVGLNPTRTALFDVLARAGAEVERDAARVEHGEPRGTVRIRAGSLRPLVLGPDDVPALIDELPALAAMATHGGDLHVTGAARAAGEGKRPHLGARRGAARPRGPTSTSSRTAFTCAAAAG